MTCSCLQKLKAVFRCDSSAHLEAAGILPECVQSLALRLRIISRGQRVQQNNMPPPNP